MAQEAEPDISKLLAQANATLNSVNNTNFNDNNMINMDVGDDNVQITEEDMNDPELLAQLAEFGDSDDENIDNNDNDDDDGDEKMFEEMKTKALESLKQKITMVENKGNQFKAASDATNFKLSQESLKELKFLYSQINKMDAIEFATDRDEIDGQIKQVYNKISNISIQPHSISKMKSQHQSKQSADLQNQINIAVGNNDKQISQQLLLQRYKMYKFAAKKTNDCGDKQTAIKYLRQSKVIAKYIEQIREGVIIWESDIPPVLQNELWQLNQTKKPINKQISEEKRELNEMFATPQQLESRIQHYRIACVKAKKDGNIPQAKEYLREFKEMEKMLKHLKDGTIKPRLGDLPPEIREGHIHINKSNKKVEKEISSQRVRGLSSIEKNEYSKIIKKLQMQIEECKSDASFLQTNPNDNQSQQLLQYVKQSQIMLSKVIKCQKLQLETPKYETFSIKVKTLNQNLDIEENELRILIGKLSNLGTKGSTDIYLIIKCENLCNITTPTKKVKFSHDFSLKKRCKIERNKRLKNKIKYAKLHIELYQKKFLGDLKLGEALLRLKPLLESSSINETIIIKPENERKKMAELQMIIKLRKPVLTEGHTVITKQLIRITHFPEVKQPMVNKKRIESKPQQTAKPKPKPKPKQNKQQKTQSVNNNSNLPQHITQEMVDNP
eukprot:468086_1